MAQASTALNFQVTKNTNPLAPAQRAEILADPGFGVKFSDHMVTIDWNIVDGWHSAQVLPYGPLAINPGASVLHYAQEVFEGLKAYRHDDGSVWTFRPEENSRRLNRSAQRLSLPQLPEELFLESLHQLLALDADWVPDAEGEKSLYLRPFMFATEQFLGVRSSQEVKFVLIASPSGPYFSGGIKPVDIWLSTDFARAGLGGTGEAKCGGNYAASIEPTDEAHANGCSQVLFLDSETHTTIDELGGMNIMFVFDDGTLVTPKLTGSILHGITRKSVLEIAKEQGLTPVERSVTLDEWKQAQADGSLLEVFACGTAAVITPLGQLKAKDFTIPAAKNTEHGEVTLALRKALTDLQYGHTKDTRGWMERLA